MDLDSLGLRVCDATSDAERAEVEEFLSRNLRHVAHEAVPRTNSDWVYRPVILQLRDSSNAVIAAALSNRSQFAAECVRMTRSGRRDSALLAYSNVVDTHSELDLIAVDHAWRGKGIGSHLIRHLESVLRDMSVRVWFGNTESTSDPERLRLFYERHGFITTAPGQSLPRLLGHDWVLPGPPPPPFYFYKKLTATQP